ncbi:MAG: hypothetical protein ACXVB6_21920 [Mucilaginibacter sp.]
MKRILLPCFMLIILISACKKNNTPQPSQDQNNASQVQAAIVGTWYYQSVNASFFVGTTDVLDEPVPTADVHALGSFKFSANNTGVYTENGQTHAFTYSVKAAKGVDSLICTGGLNTGFTIGAVDQTELNLAQDVHETNALTDRAGRQVYSDHVFFNAVLSH